jgi:hypothetical protein
VSKLKYLIKSIESAAMESLKSLGFEKMGWARIRIFTDETYGWIGFNRGSYRSENAINVNPVIGVYNIRVRKLLNSLMEWKADKYITPIVSSPLGYLMPENCYREWYFRYGVDIIPNIKDIIDSIKRYGLPWMEKQVDWKILVEVSKTNGLPGFREYLPPSIWLAYGEKEKAIEYGEIALARKVAEGDQQKYIDQYARFLDKIKQWEAPE